MKRFIILFSTVLTIPDCHASARIYSVSPSMYVSDDTITNYQEHEMPTKIYLLPPNEDNNAVEYNFYSQSQNDMKQREEVIVPSNLFLPKLLFDLLEEDKSRPVKGTRKRNMDAANVKKERNMSRKKQKKAKVLGRLLMNNASRRNYEDIQDDYIEDEDDDYWRGVNRKKMKWEDYRNEDGASVMELIALNARHKTRLRRTENNTF